MEPVLQKPNQLFTRAAKVKNSQARTTARSGIEFKARVLKILKYNINLKIYSICRLELEL